MSQSERDEWEAWVRRPAEHRVVDVVGHVFMNLRDLPEFACNDSPLRVPGTYWSPAYIAAIESYLMNARLAADFLVKMPSQDYTARTFLPEWSPPKPLAKRLTRVWVLASKEVAHLSRDRLPTTIDEWAPEDLSYRGLMRISRDCYRMLGLFVDQYEAADGTWAADFRDMHTGTEMISQRELKALRSDALRRGRTLAPPQSLQPGRRGAWPEI